MLHNNLDPAVAEHPRELVVYGGTGKAARNWDSFDAIVKTLTHLKNDETMLVQSGKPVGVFQTHEWAPRVLLANSNLVGDWANWPEFRRLEQLGLTMYGQMTAGSWIYIGTQGILQGTYETFAAAALTHFGGDLTGRLVVTGGLDSTVAEFTGVAAAGAGPGVAPGAAAGQAPARPAAQRMRAARSARARWRPNGRAAPCHRSGRRRRRRPLLLPACRSAVGCVDHLPLRVRLLGAHKRSGAGGGSRRHAGRALRGHRAAVPL
jgi:hypothetical protein